MFDAQTVKQQLVQWIADFFAENAAPETKAVVGISGGKDSATVAALCVEALGKGRVLGVLMPQGEQADIEYAYELCRFLDIEHVTVNIQNATQALYEEIIKTGLTLNTVATFNTPARIRMATLYAIAGVVGGRVANTCNLSEDWVGYATKFGDGAGDFSPLSDLTLTEVKAVAATLGLPEKLIHKTPLDGLFRQIGRRKLRFYLRGAGPIYPRGHL